MALVELTSELAIGAGTSVGSPEGRHIAGTETAPPELGVVDVIPDIDATGFTIDANSFPTQFTYANLPQIGLMEAFAPKEGIDVPVMLNPPLKEAVITITPQEFTVRGYTVTGDRANRDIGGTETDEFSTKRLSNFDIETRHNFRTPSEFRRDADPGLQLASRQPFVLRGIGSNWGPNDIGSITTAGLGEAITGNIGAMDAVKAGVVGGPSGAVTAVGGGITSDMLKLADRITEGLFIRGGMITVASRTAADEARIIKYMLSPRGLIFIGKQYLLQSMNAMQAPLDKKGAPIKAGNTRLYFPGSILASLPPGSHMVRHWGEDAVAMMANIDLGISKFVDSAGKLSSFMEKNFPDLVAGIKGATIKIGKTIKSVLAPLGEKLDSIAASVSQSKLGQMVGKAGKTAGSIVGDLADSVSGRIFPMGPPKRAGDSARDIINIYNPEFRYGENKYNTLDYEGQWLGLGIPVGLVASPLDDADNDNATILQPTVTRLFGDAKETTSYQRGAVNVIWQSSYIYDGAPFGEGYAHTGIEKRTSKTYQTLAYEELGDPKKKYVSEGETEIRKVRYEDDTFSHNTGKQYRELSKLEKGLEGSGTVDAMGLESGLGIAGTSNAMGLEGLGPLKEKEEEKIWGKDIGGRFTLGDPVDTHEDKANKLTRNDGKDLIKRAWNEKLSNIETTTDAPHRWSGKVPDKDSKEIVPSIEKWVHHTDDSSTRAKLIDRYSTLSYGHLNGDHKYLDGYDKILSAGEQNVEGSVGTVKPENAFEVADEIMVARAAGAMAHKGIGGWTNRHNEGITIEADSELGVVKKQSGKFDTDLTDKANLHPYGSEEYDEDFIPFKFKDVVNNKFIIFRAILGGISDSISPEWGDERFIGRPDKVFVYKGADRTISFDFNVYPKTKQELPVLWDKLNYLVGLCYPAWNTNRMVAPFIELSLGDMYKSTPGFLASLSISSQSESTWELDKGLRVPKYLTCSCSFRYIGKYRPSMIGKHFDFDWIRSDHDFDSFEKNPATTTDMTSPDRTKYKGLFPISPNPATETSGISNEQAENNAAAQNVDAGTPGT